MEAKIKNGKITISMPMQKPKLSGSGKSMVVATSRGKQQTSAMVDGKPVFVVANALLDFEEPNAKEHNANRKKRQP